MDLQAILDATLDELDEESDEEYKVSNDDDNIKKENTTTNNIIDNKNNENKKKNENENLIENENNLVENNNIETNNEINDTITKTLQNLAQISNDVNGINTNNFNVEGEEIMDEMLNSFQQLGNKDDYEDVMNTMISQLLSKELMYEPISQIIEKYPVWLSKNKANLNNEEYIKYGKQYQCFQKILYTYDNEPENYERLKELMFEIQEYDQPPAEIFEDLAPGLSFDNNGMPMMPNMNIPGLDQSQLPFDENCIIM